MKISPINPQINNDFSKQNVKKSNLISNTHNNISFKNFFKTKQIEFQLMKNYGMKSSLRSNDFVAECVLKTADLFANLFKRSFLPKSVKFKPFGKDIPSDVLGYHEVIRDGYDEVCFNANQECFKNKTKLKFNEMSEKLVWWHPTGNYLQTFVHEFAHSAHYHNLNNRGNAGVMPHLSNARIPTTVGRFISKFKLGRYSAKNMNEFMAERITKDICGNLTSFDQFIGRETDLDYSNIFSNKWSYRYSSPQSYLDYYTQQVWNGDLKKANEVIHDMDMYLAAIPSKEVVPVLEAVKVKAKPKSILSRIFNFICDYNAELTKVLDNKNQLDLRPKLE